MGGRGERKDTGGGQERGILTRSGEGFEGETGIVQR